MRLMESKYEDFFSGRRPKFTMSVIKKRNGGKKPMDRTPVTTSATSTPKTMNAATLSGSSKNSSPLGRLQVGPSSKKLQFYSVKSIFYYVTEKWRKWWRFDFEAGLSTDQHCLVYLQWQIVLGSC